MACLLGSGHSAQLDALCCVLTEVSSPLEEERVEGMGPQGRQRGVALTIPTPHDECASASSLLYFKTAVTI